tara:strand:+ start:357 stop:635 length:279 start_codon:yes stop_codon:yes gene_type:complete
MVKENKTLVIDKEITDEVACAHHWKINDPDGPTSSGFCKKCGIEKEFVNYLEGSAWSNDVSLDQLSKNEGYSDRSNFSQTADSLKQEDSFSS